MVLTHITLIAILIQFVANIPLLVMIMFWLKQINQRNQSKEQKAYYAIYESNKRKRN